MNALAIYTFLDIAIALSPTGLAVVLGIDGIFPGTNELVLSQMCIGPNKDVKRTHIPLRRRAVRLRAGKRSTQRLWCPM